MSNNLEPRFALFLCWFLIINYLSWAKMSGIPYLRSFLIFTFVCVVALVWTLLSLIINFEKLHGSSSASGSQIENETSRKARKKRKQTKPFFWNYICAKTQGFSIIMLGVFFSAVLLTEIASCFLSQNMKIIDCIQWSFLSLFFGFIFGGVTEFNFHPTFKKIAEYLNGAPFFCDDEVVVLTGKYKGKEARIIDYSPKGKYVTILLMENEKKISVLGYEIFRIN